MTNMRRRFTTLAAATIIGAATILVFEIPARANWQPWTNLGGEVLHSSPSFDRSYSQGTGRAFARNAAGKLMVRVRDGAGGWGDWSQFAEEPTMIDGPSAVDTGPPDHPSIDGFDVYVRTTDNQVANVRYSIVCRFGCVEERHVDLVAGTVTSAPGAVMLYPGRFDVFARGANNQLRHTWKENWTGPWAAWEELGGPAFVASPSPVSWWNGNRLDVFVKGADTHLWHKWWTSSGGWSGWENLGGVLTSAPSVIRFSDSRLDIFAKGTSDTLIHRWWDAGTGWSNWEDLGGRFQYGPAAVMIDGRIDVYVTGSTAQLEHISWS